MYFGGTGAVHMSLSGVNHENVARTDPISDDASIALPVSQK